jgi:hypothetical protein
VSRYPQGATVTLSFTVKDATGALVDASPISLTVHKPDGTATAGSPYTPTHDGTGLYHQDLPLTDIATIGHYQHALTATISGKAGVQVGSFDVFDPFEVTVLSLQDAKDMLNTTTTTDDAEILRKIATIEANIEKTTGGPILNRTITERVDISDSPWEIRVLKRPLVSVTSATDVGTGLAVDLTDSELDTNSGFIRRKLGVSYVTGSGVLSVTYVAGWGTAVPPGITEAAALILKFLWETQRGGAAAGTPFSGEETQTLPGWGFPIPVRAAWELEPYARVGAVS